MALLQTRQVSKHFGGLVAVKDLSFEIAEGSIHGLIGPNGAGKSTAFNVISGFYAPTKGQVIYDGQDISGMRPDKIASRGLVRSFQGSSVYAELSVFDNVMAGCHLRARASVARTVLGLNRSEEQAARRTTHELLEMFELADQAEQTAANLPHGLQRRLGMAVALAARPRLLMLDEPFTGMNAGETSDMMASVRTLQNQGTSVLLVEHDMQAVMGLCDMVTVLNFGQLLAEGKPAEIRNKPEVIEAYLGSAEDAAAAE
jgi:branched-chain amino acid transport system ATP-binding protein